MSQQTSSSKYAVVLSWLKDTYGTETPPNLKVNDSNINRLYKTAIDAKRQFKELSEEKEQLEAKIAEYKQNADKLELVLNTVGVNHNDNVSDGLVELAMLLDLHDVSSSAYVSALTDMYMRKDDLESEIEDLEDELYQAKGSARQYKAMQKKLVGHNKQIATSVPDTIRQRQKLEKTLQYLASKAQEYDIAIGNQKKKLSESKVSKGVFHSSLSLQAAKIKQCEEELAPLREKVGKYHGLPADIELVKLKISEAKNELERLDGEMDSTLSNMNLMPTQGHI
mmetsp:Transcript_8137/g.9020  ORF Transcript_8137/g.9020 Transcript_8137/m.9020 type:complete len:281 (-) Transcript_8137:23-865(-)